MGRPSRYPEDFRRYTVCFDLSDFPVINSTSVGPVVIEL